jgi:hypothetical protein
MAATSQQSDRQIHSKHVLTGRHASPTPPRCKRNLSLRAEPVQRKAQKWWNYSVEIQSSSSFLFTAFSFWEEATSKRLLATAAEAGSTDKVSCHERQIVHFSTPSPDDHESNRKQKSDVQSGEVEFRPAGPPAPPQSPLASPPAGPPSAGSLRRARPPRPGPDTAAGRPSIWRASSPEPTCKRKQLVDERHSLHKDAVQLSDACYIHSLQGRPSEACDLPGEN